MKKKQRRAQLYEGMKRIQATKKCACGTEWTIEKVEKGWLWIYTGGAYEKVFVDVVLKCPSCGKVPEFQFSGELKVIYTEEQKQSDDENE